MYLVFQHFSEEIQLYISNNDKGADRLWGLMETNATKHTVSLPAHLPQEAKHFSGDS